MTLKKHLMTGGREKIQGGAANTNGFSKGHIKMYYSKILIKCIHTWKKSKGKSQNNE